MHRQRRAQKSFFWACWRHGSVPQGCAPIAKAGRICQRAYIAIKFQPLLLGWLTGSRTLCPVKGSPRELAAWSPFPRLDEPPRRRIYAPLRSRCTIATTKHFNATYGPPPPPAIGAALTSDGTRNRAPRIPALVRPR